jgi:hypothetical protein
MGGGLINPDEWRRFVGRVTVDGMRERAIDRSDMRRAHMFDGRDDMHGMIGEIAMRGLQERAMDRGDMRMAGIFGGMMRDDAMGGMGGGRGMRGMGGMRGGRGGGIDREELHLRNDCDRLERAIARMRRGLSEMGYHT